MQSLSVFDMFKIGVGPSSSHTMGPWLAAKRFLEELTDDQLAGTKRVQVDLFGSLAKTGKGHGTDIAVQLGLCGCDPRTVDVDSIDGRIKQIAAEQQISLLGQRTIAFHPKQDIVFHREEELPFHPNGMRLTAFEVLGEPLASAEFYSIGGGFIVKEGEDLGEASITLPFPIDAAEDLLRHCREQGLSISEVVRQNELVWRDAASVA